MSARPDGTSPTERRLQRALEPGSVARPSPDLFERVLDVVGGEGGTTEREAARARGERDEIESCGRTLVDEALDRRAGRSMDGGERRDIAVEKDMARFIYFIYYSIYILVS